MDERTSKLNMRQKLFLTLLPLISDVLDQDRCCLDDLLIDPCNVEVKSFWEDVHNAEFAKRTEGND